MLQSFDLNKKDVTATPRTSYSQSLQSNISHTALTGSAGDLDTQRERKDNRTYSFPARLQRFLRVGRFLALRLRAVVNRHLRRAREALSERAKRRAEKSARRQASLQKVQRNSDLLVLEPRMVFDAAAAATADQTADQVAEQQATDAQSDNSADAEGGKATDWQQEAAAAAGIEQATHTNEIAFVDGSIENLNELLEGIDPSVEVVMLDPNRDGVEQIAAALQDRQDLDAIHILSHGDQGKLYLGNDVLDAASMQGEHLDELTVIRNALSADGDILVYGCDFTGGGAGLEAAMLLGSITGADIAASTDGTGAENLGGDWNLETEVGTVEAETIVAGEWDGLLAGETVFTSGFETGAATTHVTAPYDGWSSNDGAIEIWRDGVNGWTSPFGDFRIELNDDPGNFFPDARDIFRDVNTIAGAEYTLTYSYGGRPGFDATVNSMNVVVDGTVLSNETDNAVGNTDIVWSNDAVTFTGNGGVMRVSFEAAGVGVAGGRGMHLDNIVLTRANVGPAATNDTSSAVEDTTLIVNAASGLLTNDVELDGDTLSVTQFDVGGTTYAADTTASLAEGDLTINSDGSYTFVPAADYNGPVPAATYTVTDGTDTDTATLKIDVTPANDAPTAVGNDYKTNEDTILSGNTLADDTGTGIDSDIDGDALSIDASSVGTFATAQGGSVTIAADGTFTYTPPANYSGSDSFNYTVTDGGLTDTATVTVSVAPVDDAPTALDDLVLLNEDTSTSFNPLSNDGDPDGAVFLTDFTQPASGLLELNVGEAGSLTTDSNGTTVNFSGTYTNPVVFAFVTTQNETADAPVIARVSNVTGNSFDLALVEPNSGNRFDTTDGVHGLESVSYVVLEAGVWTLEDGTIVEVGTHSVGSNANSFTAVSFDHSFTASPAVISQVQTDNNGIEFNNARQRAVSAGGYQVTNEPADYQSTAISTPETIGFIAIEAGTGTWSGLDFEAGVTSDSVRHGDTSINFTNDLGTNVNFLGQLATFDGPDNAHLDASSLSGTGVNVSIQEDRTRDSENRHTTERASWLTIGGNGTLTAVGGTNFSIASSDIDFAYTPADDVNGDQTFTYTITDDAGLADSATVTLRVAPVGDTVTDTRTILEDSGPTVINVLNNDNFEGPVTLTSVSAPTNGTVSFDTSGNVTYTPNPDFNGVETLTYTVAENDLGITETGTLVITVTPLNDPPTATDNTNTTDEDTPVSGNVITDNSGPGIDADPENDTLTVTQIDGAAYTPGTPVTLASGAQVTFQPNGTYTYNPYGRFEALNAGDSTTDTFSYQVSDGNGGFDTATVTITITGVNDIPSLSVSSPAVTEGTDPHAVFTVTLSNPSFEAITVSFNLTDGTASGSGTDYGPALEVSTDGGATWMAATSATIPAGATSLLVRTPISDDSIDEPTETFDLTATVTAGTTTNATASGTASINDDDDAPAISIDDVTVNEAAGSATFTVTLSNPSASTVTVTVTVTVNYDTNSGSATEGADFSGTNGTLTFAPGVTTQTVTVAITDDAIFENLESFSVDLTNVSASATITDNQGIGTIRDDGIGPGGTDDDTPTLTVSSPTVTEGTDPHAVFTVALSNPSTQPITANLNLTDGSATASDYGPALEVSTDGGATWSAATSATIPPGATSILARVPIIDDAIDEPTENFDLTATITAGTTTNVTASGTASIIDNDATPIASDDTFIVAEDTSLSIDVLGNDNDPDNDPLTVTMIDGQAPTIGTPIALRDGTGTATLNGDGTITFQPARDYNGPVAFDYEISDGANTATATVTGTVTPVDEPSVPPETSGTTFEQLQEQTEHIVPTGNSSETSDPLTEIGGNNAIVLETVAAIDRSGVAPADVALDGIVLDTVNNIHDLGALAELPTDDRPTMGHIRDVEKLRALAQSAQRAFGDRFGHWDGQALRGFSLHIDVPGIAAMNDSSRTGQIVIDTLMRDHVLFIEIKNDLSADTHGKISEHRILQADGRPLPTWVHHTASGTLLAEVPVDTQKLDLHVIALLEDGSSIEQKVAIQTMSGEIKPLAMNEDGQRASNFDAQLNSAVVGDMEEIRKMDGAITNSQPK